MFFLYNATATTEVSTYGHTLSLHDALPICKAMPVLADKGFRVIVPDLPGHGMSNPPAGEPSIELYAETVAAVIAALRTGPAAAIGRSEEHTSELQSLMRLSYAVFCLHKKNPVQGNLPHITITYSLKH